MLTINSRSPWEIISGFNLTAKRRAKRQGMKLCSGIRTICDSTWLDQSHACYLFARKLDPTAGSPWLQSRRHATWINHPFVVISMSKVELYFSCIFLSCFPDIKVWKLVLISKQIFTKRLLSLRSWSLLLAMKWLNFSFSSNSNNFLTLKFKFLLWSF